MKVCLFRSTLSAALVILAGFISTLSPPAAAQTVTVNGVSCPTATIQLTAAGMITTLPSTCSGNGNPCAAATVTYSSTGIAIQTPTPNVCLNATPTESPISLQTVQINGNGCNAATVIFTASAVSISAPTTCLDAVAVLPIITGVDLASGYVGQTLGITGSNFASGATVTIGGVAANILGTTGTTSLSVLIPTVATGAQPIVVTTGTQSSQALSFNIVNVPASGALIAVQSRKVHGAAGTFNIAIDTTPLIDGAVTVEPRSAGAGHVIVFKFNGTVGIAGSASAVDSTGAMVGTTQVASGDEVLVTLANGSDARRVTVSLLGVNGTTNAAASIGFLFGDVNNSRTVNAADISGVKSRSGQAVSPSNFKFDVNASGAINSSDISTVKARSGTALPP